MRRLSGNRDGGRIQERSGGALALGYARWFSCGSIHGNIPP
jgi:hypothetical protein